MVKVGRIVLRVPQDISVAGYDGVPLLQLCQPRPTTFRQDAALIGTEASRALVHLIEPAHVLSGDHSDSKHSAAG